MKYLFFLLFILKSATVNSLENYEEKCYCISKAKENDGTDDKYSPGSSNENYSCRDFKIVYKDTCVTIHKGELIASDKKLKK